MNLPGVCRVRLKRRERLSRHTGLGVGGRAFGWFEPRDADDLVVFLKNLPRAFAIIPIGAGSNLLAADGKIEKIFIRLSSPAFRGTDICGERVLAGAGVFLPELVRTLVKNGLGGCEFLAGIPGTVGGAVAMNAGARSVFSRARSYRAIKDIFIEAHVVDRRGRRKIIKKSAMRFAYRKASLRGCVVVAAVFGLKKTSASCARRRVRQLLAERRRHQDRTARSAGSFFKNPARGPAAGILIDACGLKGRCVGRACVSAKHANFIVNKGGARYRDVIKLVEIIRKTVYNRFKIRLHPEVKIVA